MKIYHNQLSERVMEDLSEGVEVIVACSFSRHVFLLNRDCLKLIQVQLHAFKNSVSKIFFITKQTQSDIQIVVALLIMWTKD